MSEIKDVEYYTKSNRYDRLLNAPGGPYDQWLNDMANRPGALLTPIAFNPGRYPEQTFREPKREAHDPYSFVPDNLYYKLFRRKWAGMMGGIAVWDSLTEQIRQTPTSLEDNTPVMDTVAGLMDEGKNVLTVTSHYSFEELGYFKALRFALRRDRSRLDRIDTVINKLMARQSIKGKPIIRQFTKYSNVYFSYPKTASSRKFEVPEEIIEDGNRQMLRTLVSDLRMTNPGHEVDIALTGKQIVTIRSDDGRLDHYDIPDIDPSSAGLVKLFDYAYGATMVKSPKTGEYELVIGDLIDVKKRLQTGKPEDVVDEIYEPIAESVERITGVETVYRRLGRQALAAE